MALALSLAWGLRGQHGHERGAAVAGAMAGLSLAAVTGGPQWIGGAVVGSLGFAIGGALSYGRFVNLAYQGSWEAIGSLALIGFVWGGLGSLCLGLGLALPRYKRWERMAVAGGLLVVWYLVDRLLWGRLDGPGELRAREMTAVLLLGVWVLLSAYVGVWRQDRTSLRLALAGAIGFGVGFPLAAWVQGAGAATGIRLDWWKIGEHVTGLCGGFALGLAGLTLESRWVQPMVVRPLERWLALAWLLWLLPSWIIANSIDYWVTERALLPATAGKAVWSVLGLILAGLAVWGWLEVRRGRTFVTSWMPRHLRSIFLVFLWLTTVIAASKTLVVGAWSSTPLGFVLLAWAITWIVRRETGALA